MTKPDIPQPESVESGSNQADTVPHRASQDQRVVNTIREARRMILKLRELPEAAEMMTSHGYDQTKLEEGLALCQAAFNAFDERSDRMAQKQHASAQLKEADLIAREIYADFKSVCQALFPEESDWTALAVEGTTPDDRNGFILKARDAYVGGQRPPYDQELGKYGFGSEVMQQAAATLDRLEAAEAAYRAEVELAKDSTKKRDAAADELRTWIKKFEAILKVVLKGKPSLVEILEHSD
ncbi:MAG: hypothetical protein PVI78_10505 [Anaerolineales bacterium]|jgi:hypothetical protein